MGRTGRLLAVRAAAHDAAREDRLARATRPSTSSRTEAGAAIELHDSASVRGEKQLETVRRERRVELDARCIHDGEVLRFLERAIEIGPDGNEDVHVATRESIRRKVDSEHGAREPKDLPASIRS